MIKRCFLSQILKLLNLKYWHFDIFANKKVNDTKARGTKIEIFEFLIKYHRAVIFCLILI